MFIVMENIEDAQELAAMIKKRSHEVDVDASQKLLPFFHEEMVKSLIFQLAHGIWHVHSNGFVHRDIKVENCLIDKNLNLYLIDFGLAEACAKEYREKIIVGTKLYMAPEILDQSINDNPYLPPCDIWAMGVTMYLLMSGHFPFFGFELEDQIKYGYLEFKQPCWKHVSQEAKDLISMML